MKLIPLILGIIALAIGLLDKLSTFGLPTSVIAFLDRIPTFNLSATIFIIAGIILIIYSIKT